MASPPTQAALDCPNPVGAWSYTPPVRAVIRELVASQEGDIYYVGDFEGTRDFAPEDEVDLHESAGDHDVYVTKLLGGGGYEWTMTWGGALLDEGQSIATSSTGDVYVLSLFHGTADFDPSGGVDEHTASSGFASAAFTRVRADGSYGETISFGEGDGDALATALDVDSEGNVYIVGCFEHNIDFDPGDTSDLHSSAPTGRNAFVTRFNAGGSYSWTRTFGGSGLDCATGIDVDRDGDPRIKGIFRSTVDFDPTDGEDFHTGGIDDIFVMKLNADGLYGWTRTWNGAKFPSYVGQIAVAGDGSAVITGLFNRTVDFDPTRGVDFHSAPDATTALFVTTIADTGAYVWTRSLTSVDRVVGSDAAFLEGGVVVTGGFKGSTDFRTLGMPDVRVPIGGDDLFVTGLALDGTVSWARTMGSVFYGDYGKTLAVSTDGAIVISGHYSNTIDLDPGCGVQEHSPATSSDRFVLKLVCPEPTADASADGFIDLIDFAAFQRCFSGPAPTTCGDGCETLDLDADDDIDLDDYFVFSTLQTP